MNDLAKIQKGVGIALDLLPLYLLLAETINTIIEIALEHKDEITPSDLARIKALVPLDQTVFD